jgi:hypothetical protein
MGDDRSRILDLLAQGKITVEEATRLLDALGSNASQSGATEGAGGASTGSQNKGWTSGPGAGSGSSSAKPRFMFVKVLSAKGDNVNVKIPLALVRAGLKLTSLIPQPAMDQINKNMAEKGMKFDLNNFKPEDLEDLLEALREMEINVDSTNGDNVRVYAG